MLFAPTPTLDKYVQKDGSRKKGRIVTTIRNPRFLKQKNQRAQRGQQVQRVQVQRVRGGQERVVQNQRNQKRQPQRLRPIRITRRVNVPVARPQKLRRQAKMLGMSEAIIPIKRTKKFSTRNGNVQMITLPRSLRNLPQPTKQQVIKVIKRAQRKPVITMPTEPTIRRTRPARRTRFYTQHDNRLYEPKQEIQEIVFEREERNMAMPKERRKPQPATSFPTVKVSNVPTEYSRTDILGAFKDHFDVQDVIMKNRGTALVLFNKMSDAKHAKEQFDGGEMNDHKIKVTWAENVVV